ncbi:MAG: Hpt domain-containing protein, partial [Pseudomonadota bacterium]
MNNNTIYDKEKSIKLAGGRENIANELIEMLICELPKLEAEIKSALEGQNMIQLKASLHKLKGSISYCIVPRLSQSINVFHDAVTNNEKINHLDLFNQLNDEIRRLEQFYKKQN